MVRHIVLNVDEKFFFKLKEHKAQIEDEEQLSMTWEEYIQALFDLK